MPLQRKFAVQGHAVPTSAYYPRNVFDPKLTNRLVVNYGDEADSLPEQYDNVKMYRCRSCREVMEEREIEYHVCDDYDQDFDEED